MARPPSWAGWVGRWPEPAGFGCCQDRFSIRLNRCFANGRASTRRVALRGGMLYVVTETDGLAVRGRRVDRPVGPR